MTAEGWADDDELEKVETETADDGRVTTRFRFWEQPSYSTWAEPTFVRLTSARVVHVLGGWTSWDDSDAAALFRRERVLCGRLGEAGDQTGVETFPDEALCRKCASAVPEEHRRRLFEHSTESED